MKNNPIHEDEIAWEIAVNPMAFGTVKYELMMNRGYQHYIDGNDANESALIRDVDDFITDAFDEPSRSEVIANPSVDINQPGRLVIIAALGSILVKRHPKIVSNPKEPRVDKYVQELYHHHLYAAAYNADEKLTIRKALGRVVYSRDKEDDLGPAPGQAIEDVVKLEGFRDTPFYKIPLTHANRKCEARMNNERDGDLRCVIRGCHVYIPIDDVEEKYTDYFYERGGVTESIERLITNNLKDAILDDYQAMLTNVNSRIEELIELGKDDFLFEPHQYPMKLKAILQAVQAADHDLVSLGTPHTSEEMMEAINQHQSETQIGWVQKVLEDIGGTSGLGSVLSQYAKDDDIDHVTLTEGEGTNEPNRYVLEYSTGDYKVVEVTDIEEILELPCMSNLDQLADQAEAPRRWYLYSFVRILLELDTGFSVEDIKEFFSRYPWYKEDVTEYQVGYEKRQVMSDNEPPLPVGCNNDNKNFERLCIGRENCDYSIYQSLNFRPEVYERLEGRD